MTDVPADAAPGAAFRKNLEGGVFALHCCTACDRQIYYPRTLCPHCGSLALEWRAASGRGVVYSTTVVR
ncbi:MAG TPA: zinc ribbon domain-containing protein, partial [Rhizomicrobium sp.]